MIDGTKYAFLTTDQLKQAYITQDEIFILGQKKKYKMTPSAVASVVLLLEAMGKGEKMNINNELQEDTKLQDEEYAVLSKVDDKILIVPFEYNQLE